MLAKSREELSMLQRRIEGWNEVLHRKESKQSEIPETESGILLDLEDSKQKLTNTKTKLKNLNEYPEDVLYHAGILETLYLWCQRNINHIFFMKYSELVKLEEKLKKGTHLLTNPVIEYHLKAFRLKKEEKICLEINKYNALCAKLSTVHNSKTSELIPIEEIEENKKQDHENKEPFSSVQLLKKIIGSSARLLLSATQGICFTLMIIVHIFNGNILSLIYVLSIFFYALVTKCRPHKLYWEILRLYTGIVIGLKYLCSFIELLLSVFADSNVFENTQAKVKVVQELAWIKTGIV
jgi:hypothetical protein